MDAEDLAERRAATSLNGTLKQLTEALALSCGDLKRTLDREAPGGRVGARWQAAQLVAQALRVLEERAVNPAKSGGPKRMVTRPGR